MIVLRNNKTVPTSRVGKGRRRQNTMLRSIAAVLIPVMAIGPDTVLALHNEAMAYRAIAEAIALAAIAQSGGSEAETFTYDNNGNLIEHVSPDANVSSRAVHQDILHFRARALATRATKGPSRKQVRSEAARRRRSKPHFSARMRLLRGTAPAAIQGSKIAGPAHRTESILAF